MPSIDVHCANQECDSEDITLIIVTSAQLHLLSDVKIQEVTN